MADHDHSCKLLFAQPEMVAHLLGHLAKQERWVAELDLTTLDPVPARRLRDDEEQDKPGRSEMNRAFLTWLRRVRLPSRFPGLKLPELRQEEKSAMLEERVRRWTENWKAEGRQEGEAIALTRLLEFKFGSLAADYRERIRAAKSSKRQEWMRRILTAQRPEEVSAQQIAVNAARPQRAPKASRNEEIRCPSNRIPPSRNPPG